MCNTRVSRRWTAERSGTRCGRRTAVAIGGLAALLTIGAIGGCDRVISDAPTGQSLVYWADPYDRDALLAALPHYRKADLTGYDYVVLLPVQNLLSTGFAVTLEVNGQDVERRYVGPMTQEVFAVTPAMVLETEKTTGVASKDIPFLGTTVPFVVRLKNYVTEDDHIIQNTNFLLAPTNYFENAVETNLPDDGVRVDAHFVSPGAFVVVAREGRLDVIELDREWQPVNEENDNDDQVVGNQTQQQQTQQPPTQTGTQTTTTEQPPPTYLAEEIQVVSQLGLGYLITGHRDATTTGGQTGTTGKIFVTDQDPFDSAAVESVVPQFVAEDLSGYNFSMLFLVQNRLTYRVAVTMQVNGQDIERRVIEPRTQETFVVTEALAEQTEAGLGFVSKNVDARLNGHSCPFVVRFKDYVTQDGHIMQPSDFLLAARNNFETMSTKKELASDGYDIIDGTMVAPGGFVIVIKDTHAEVYELDREHVGTNETDDDEDVVVDYKAPDTLEFHNQTMQVLTQLGLDSLLNPAGS